MDNDFSISYAYLACNEIEELKFSLQLIKQVKRPQDEIVILLDKDNYSKEIIDYIQEYADIVAYNSLQNNFSQQKNKLISLCTKDYILNLDADEYITADNLKKIIKILAANLDVDLFYFPRINLVTGISMEHIDKWGWVITKNENYKNVIYSSTALYQDVFKFIRLLQKYDLIIENSANLLYYYEPIINYPDLQGRLWKNNKSIRWVNKVHERLIGYETIATMPFDIIHKKEIKKQEKQNEFYNTIN